VENVLYRIPSHPFIRKPSKLAARFLDAVDTAKNVTLEDVSSCEFEAFLSVLHPTDFEHGDVHSVEDWIFVLRLATRWGFESIRKLAINRLDPIATPIDKIVEGKACGVEKWLVPGFADLCNRAGCLTKEEGRRLGVDDVIFIASMRE
ncbi:uncharacterized protein STEHIDRAFT_30913, partial [Stereum hirsutum FP-91666 SS1]